MNEKWNGHVKNLLKIGTPECAVFFGVVAMVLALLFLTVGFWQTLLIAALVAVGVFLGGVKDKKEWLRGLINRLFPPKQSVPFREQSERAEQISQQLERQTAPLSQETAEENDLDDAVGSDDSDESGDSEPDQTL